MRNSDVVDEGIFNTWDDLCKCGHRMREHILDWDLDPEIDCRVEGCTCPEFRPVKF
jgi:hypothetical protein